MDKISKQFVTNTYETINPNSVEINRTTRGVTWSVKSYGSNLMEITDKVVEVCEKLEEKYYGEE